MGQPPGHRVSDSTSVGGAFEFLYDIQGHTVAQIAAGTSTLNLAEIYAGGRHWMTYNGGPLFMHTDWLGTPRAWTNTSGTRVSTCTNLLFGDGGGCVNYISNTHFTGQEYNGEDGLTHFPARMYSMTQGRWMHPDPAGLAAVDITNPQTWNRYAYVTNNPVSYVDPLGLEVKACPPGTPDGTICLEVDGGGGGGNDGWGPCNPIDCGGGGVGGVGGGTGGGGGGGGGGGLEKRPTVVLPPGSEQSCQDQLAAMYNLINAIRPPGTSVFKGLGQRINQFLHSMPGTGYADPGHVQQFEGIQNGLNNRINNYRNSGCGDPPADIAQWAGTPLPNPLPSSSSQFSVPGWLGPGALITAGAACAVFVPGCLEIEVATAPAW